MEEYTGVGSRETPVEICQLMTNIAICLCAHGLTLRSGGAIGADSAFEAGAGNLKEIYLAKDSTEEAEAIAAKFHPAWHKCGEYARKLHGRNAFQVLGKTLNKPSKFLICWTPDGCDKHVDRVFQTGGTGTAISIASNYGIPIYNLKNEDAFREWTRYVTKTNEWFKTQE